jgi:hypothetical protein
METSDYGISGTTKVYPTNPATRSPAITTGNGGPATVHPGNNIAPRDISAEAEPFGKIEMTPPSAPDSVTDDALGRVFTDLACNLLAGSGSTAAPGAESRTRQRYNSADRRRDRNGQTGSGTSYSPA